ncbi:MAG TPA: hypothetical protein VLW17_01045 [Thermoanaerobaculaceae bacterium]|nr:hypothetical protein [Thermoanaerobaculaceae bacterium]
MTDPAGTTLRTWAAASAWFAAALVLYLATGARGLIWADSSKLTLYALKGYLPSLNPGDHAGWVALAWAWLRLWGGDPIVAAHRFSAFAGAALVALAFLWTLRGGRDAARAHTVAAVLVVALPVWWASTVAETYATAMALALAGAVAAQGGSGWRRSVAAGGLWGLALATHALVGFLVVPLAWQTLGRRAWRVAPGLALGLAPMWLAVFGAPLDPLTGFAAGGASSWRWVWGAFIAAARIPRQVPLVAALLLYALGPMVMGMLARRRGVRPPVVWLVSLAMLTVVLAAYAPYRLHVMIGFLVVGLVLAVPLRLKAILRAGHIALQASLYLAVPALLEATGHDAIGARVLPFRDNAGYFLCPIKRGTGGIGAPGPVAEPRAHAWVRKLGLPTRWDAGAERYVAALGVCAPARAVVIADFNVGAVLRLAQVVRAWRGDLEIEPVAVDVAQASAEPAKALAAAVRRAGTRPAVLADAYEPYYHVQELGRELRLERCEAGVRVLPFPPTTGR